MKVGSLVYIVVEGLNPAWRQAIVLAVFEQSEEVVFAARIWLRERTGDLSDISTFKVNGQTFAVVRGDIDRSRELCRHPHRALEEEPEVILEAAKGLLDQEGLCYATASEDLPEQTRKKEPRKPKKEQSSDSEQDASSDEPGDDLLAMLARAQRTKEGKGTGSAKPDPVTTRRSSRYAMLDRSKDKKEKSADLSLETLVQNSLTSGSGGLQSNQLNMLVQLEILKSLQKKKGKHREVSPDSSSRDSSLSSEESGKDEKLRGAGRAMKAYRMEQKNMKKHPERHIKRYIKEVENFLGADRDSVYQLTDYTKKLNWGRQKGLMRVTMRVHYALSHILQQMLKGKHQQAALQTTQLLRALHQCALDEGEWRTAWLLLHLQDPVERPKFGGEPQSLETIAAYVKAMSELERKNKSWPDRSTYPDKEEGGGKGKKGKKNKKGDDKTEEQH